MDDAFKAGKKFQKLVEILDTLRGDEGCPWDREQDAKSIGDYFLEEVYEAIDAIYENNHKALAEELGDVLMEVVFLARIYKEEQKFTISDSLENINQKMTRRHPHVFENREKKTSEGVIDDWRRQKKIEKKRDSFFDGLLKTSPALLEAFQTGQQASSFGFDWNHSLDAMKKVKEEVAELEKALEDGREEEIRQEIGDLLFSMANVSRLSGINPEIALRRANRKFVGRFKAVEEKLKKQGRSLDQASLEEMDKIWDSIKDKA
jgi:MazG family protein